MQITWIEICSLLRGFPFSTGRTQRPRRKQRGCALAWRRRQDGLHSRQQRDRRYRARISALGRDDHHGIALLQVRQRAVRQAAQHALQIRRTVPAWPAARPARRLRFCPWPRSARIGRSPLPGRTLALAVGARLISVPAAPFNRIAMRCAISAGSFFICESGDTFTTTALLRIASCTVIVLLAASIALMVPAIFRNAPETTSSALTSLPSGLRVPRARN